MVEYQIVSVLQIVSNCAEMDDLTLENSVIMDAPTHFHPIAADLIAPTLPVVMEYWIKEKSAIMEKATPTLFLEPADSTAHFPNAETLLLTLENNATMAETQ